jgi:hypothetical protein
VGLCVLGILASTAYTVSRTVVLPQGEEVTALGYGLTYQGSRIIDSGKRTSYDVILRTADAAYLMSPVMYPAQDNQGMMKKPAIRSFAVRDAYLAPGNVVRQTLEERLQQDVELRKGEPTRAHGLILTLEEFRIEERAMEGHSHAVMEITPVIRVITDRRETGEILPLLRRYPDGYQEVLTVEIPGTGHQARISGLSADEGIVRLALSPVPTVLGKGEQADLNGCQVQLVDFQVEIDPEGRFARLEADTHVRVGNEVFEVRPAMTTRGGGHPPEFEEFPVGWTGMNLVLAGVDSDRGTASFHLVPAPRELLYAELSLKPFILLLWVGSALAVFGLALSVAYRFRLANVSARAEGTAAALTTRSSSGAGKADRPAA